MGKIGSDDMRASDAIAAFWVIGLFIGIDMLFAGGSLVITALTIRGSAVQRI